MGDRIWVITSDIKVNKIITERERKQILLVEGFDETKEFGLDLIPKMAYSIPDEVQGVSFYDSAVILSESYGRFNFSYLEKYDISKSTDLSINILGYDVPLNVLSIDKRLSRLRILPMSEEIEFIGDNLYIMSEAASSKYMVGRLYSAKYIRYININDIN